MNGNGRQGIGTMVVAGALGLALAACDSGSSEQASVATAMQASMQAQLTTLWTASKALQAAAPAPTGRGWDKTMDATALDAMKAAWKNARDAYEHVEGATAPIFFEIDVAIDERYDGFLSDTGPDTDLFDGQGVTGMHAIERVLYADVTPPSVVAFEMPLPGYKAAAWPATEQEADEFKNELCARLVTDTKTLLDSWTPKRIDVTDAFGGLISLVNEQQEKVNKAATNTEESRYSQRTMADLRANLAGTVAIYQVFRDWLKTKPAMGSTPSGTDVDASIMSGLDGLGTLYATVTGDAIPEPPATWSAEHVNTPADLDTPFGKLYTQVHDAVDPKNADSIVSHMNEAATLLGLEGFTE
jgi:iron uptake system component EfeO